MSNHLFSIILRFHAPILKGWLDRVCSADFLYILKSFANMKNLLGLAKTLVHSRQIIMKHKSILLFMKGTRTQPLLSTLNQCFFNTENKRMWVIYSRVDNYTAKITTSFQRIFSALQKGRFKTISKNEMEKLLKEHLFTVIRWWFLATLPKEWCVSKWSNPP